MEVREQLERSRLDLLDLTNRNRLLSCAATSRGGLQIVDELSDEVYRILVGDSRAMSFVAREEDPEGESQPVMFGQPDAVEPDPNRHTDNKLQTALGDEQLQRKLLRLYRASKTLIEEQGVNTLYLALGFLHWRESPSVDQFRRAPLILIPVELDRTSVRARFRVTFSGEEIGPNLSLEEKLRLEFGIQLPSLPDSDELSPSNYYESVWRAVQRQDGWTVKPDGMQLGFFSFTKLLMYRDLDVSSWPEGKEPQGHPILAGLLGEDGLVEPGDLVPSDSIDEHPEASDLAQILDADSSQIKAMIEARTARAMIIQGPPGTGKSQTIANLIADAIQRGKRLLFVAEKMAALDVVKRRLDANGVGVACLELHSRTANKKLVLAELGRTLDLGRPKQQQTSISELSQLDSTRERLTRYAKAVNQSIGETGVSPRIAFVRDRNATRSLRKGAPPVKLGEADEWPHSDFREKRIAVEELQARVREGGLPRANPYWGSRRELFLPSDAVELNDALDATRTAVEEVDLAGRRVAEALSVAAPGSIGEADRLHAAVDQVANAPSLEGCDPSSPAWADIANDLTRIFNSGEEQQEIRARLGDTLLPEAWGRDVLQLRADLQATGRSWIRFLLPRWRNARAELAGLCVGEPPKGVDAMLDALDGILQESRLSSQLESERGLLEKIFELPSDYSNVDWPSRRAQAEWVFETRHQIDAGELPSWSFDIDPREARDSAGEQRALATSLANSGNSSKTLTDFLQLDQSRIDGGSLTEIGFPKLKGRIEAMGTRPGALRTLAAFNQKAKQLCEKGLAPLVEAVEKQETPGLDLVALFDHCRYDSLIRRAFEERSELREFDRAEHEHTIERFRKLDKLQFEVHRLRTGLTH